MCCIDLYFVDMIVVCLSKYRSDNYYMGDWQRNKTFDLGVKMLRVLSFTCSPLHAMFNPVLLGKFSHTCSLIVLRKGC